MSARSSARYVGMLLVAGIAPGANAAEINLGSAGTTQQISTAVSLPAFLDASRLADMQAAWRTRFSGQDLVVATPVVNAVSDPEAGTISEARQTLTRAEQVTIEAVAVRDRAEELSRRFAVDAAAESAVAVNAGPAPAVPDSIVTETAAISADAVPAAEVAPAAELEPAAPALIQKAVATTVVTPKNDMAPASMLGGPRTEAAAEAAPVIEDMVPPKAQPQAKRIPVAPPARRTIQAASVSDTPGLISIFSSLASGDEEPTAHKPAEPTTPSGLPTEIRSFGWTQ